MHEAASARQVRGWWRRWPQANVGVVTGEVSGVAVVDVDPRHGGDASLRDLEARWQVLPIAPEVRTGGGGRHLWFRLDVPAPCTTLASGVDLKGDGGMVVVPPSVHTSGGRYVWRAGGSPDELSLPLLPRWLAASAHGGDTAIVAACRLQPPLRTVAEQREFAAAWHRVGIELLPGDRYYLCPFHEDHHPSLHIDAEGCRWYCFGCGSGGGIGRLLRRLGERQAPAPRARFHRRVFPDPPITLHGVGEVEVVGESAHQDELLDLAGGHRRYGGVDIEAVAELVLEPHNPYDAAAVLVRIEGRSVGHVARRDVVRLRPIIDESLDLHGMATCRAVIRGGWDRGRGDVGRFGVVLLLAEDDDAPEQTGPPPIP